MPSKVNPNPLHPHFIVNAINSMTSRARIAILEFVSGGGMSTHPLSEIPPSLLREGTAMLHALASDWARLPDSDVSVCWDSRLGRCRIPGISTVTIDAQHSFLKVWNAIVRDVDFAIVIAPEIDNQLVELVEHLGRGNTKLINADIPFLRTASDKWLTAQSFCHANIKHPPTYLLYEVLANNSLTEQFRDQYQRWTIKPRDGAGCDRIELFSTFEDAMRAGNRMCAASVPPHEYILQPWLEGIAGSVVALCGDGRFCVLPTMSQNIIVGDKPTNASKNELLASSRMVRYAGGSGPWHAIAQAEMNAFVAKVLAAIPGKPMGWIGIDFIAIDSSQQHDSLVAIEVNPRLTTSYLGLRKIIAENLAGLMMQASFGNAVQYTRLEDFIDF